jgi:uncharacterized protein (DUF1501 family)
MKTHRLDRRDLLKLGAASLLLPSVARAAVRADAPASRVLILNLTGGIRSSAAFFASSAVKYNPWGIIDSIATPFPIGQLLDDHLGVSAANARAETIPGDAGYTLDAAGPWAGARVPRFRESAAAGRYSVAGTWHPGRGDHLRARVEEVTGSADGEEPGLLVRVFGALAATAPERAAVPPVHLRPQSTFGLAKGNVARYAPVSLAGPEALPVSSADNGAVSSLAGRDFARDEPMRERIDRLALASRRGYARELAEVFATHRRASRTVGEQLAQGFLKVTDPENAAAAAGTVLAGDGSSVPLTNLMLSELFTRAATGGAPAAELGGEDEMSTAAMDIATAVRLLQLGSKAVAVELGFFDYHSDERRGAVPLYRFLGRAIAALEWLLSRIPDPEVPGVSMLDRTLVLTRSDFGRDPGPSRGFNGGEGSDHGTDPSCYYLAHLAFGGGVRGGRVAGRVDPATFDARREAERHSPRALLATVLWALGLPYNEAPWGFEDVAQPISGLWGARV